MRDTKEKKAMGYFVPMALAANMDLSWNDKAVYALYHYFTFYGNRRICSLPIKEISKRLGVSERTVKYSRSKLKECGFISSDGGIKTKALVKYEGGEAPMPDGGEVQYGEGADFASYDNNDTTAFAPQGGNVCTLEETNLSSHEDNPYTMEGATSVPIIENNKENTDKNRDVIKTETTVVKRDGNLPLEERMEIPVEVEAEKEQTPQRSAVELDETLLEWLEGRALYLVCREYDKFIAAIRNGKYKGRERAAETRQQTFMTAFQDEQEREDIQSIYEKATHPDPEQEWLIDYIPSAEGIHRARRKAIVEQKKEEFFQILNRHIHTAPEEKDMEDIARLLEECIEEEDSQQLYRYFNEFLADSNYPTLEPL